MCGKQVLLADRVAIHIDGGGFEQTVKGFDDVLQPNEGIVQLRVFQFDVDGNVQGDWHLLVYGDGQREVDRQDGPCREDDGGVRLRDIQPACIDGDARIRDGDILTEDDIGLLVQLQVKLDGNGCVDFHVGLDAGAFHFLKVRVQPSGQVHDGGGGIHDLRHIQFHAIDGDNKNDKNDRKQNIDGKRDDACRRP